MKHANAELYDLLLYKQPTPEKAWLPSSPEHSSLERPAPIYQVPFPGTVPKRIGKFLYPPKGRLRSKTSDDGQASSSVPAAAAVSPLALAQDAETDLLAREDLGGIVAEDFGADE